MLLRIAKEANLKQTNVLANCSIVYLSCFLFKIVSLYLL